MSCNSLAYNGDKYVFLIMVYTENEANFIFPEWSLFTIKKQIIFKTRLCKRTISYHFSLRFPFFPLVHPFASSVPQKLPSKNIYEKWQNCLFCLISVKSNADFSIMAPGPTKARCSGGDLGSFLVLKRCTPMWEDTYTEDDSAQE